MKDLFKLKWEMHKGVNYIFYAIVIVLGILIGLGIKKIIPLGAKVPENIQQHLRKLVY